jgi:tape measure domain-containing protein
MSDERKTLELRIRVAAEEALKSVAALKGEMRSLAHEAKQFAGPGGSALAGSLTEAGTAAKESARSIEEITKAAMKLGEAAALTKALSVIKDMGAFALSTAGSFQTARNQFGVLLGDMEAGAGLFNEIKAFNDKTPFSLDALTQATNVLIAAKVPLEDLQNQLTRFGDLSQGNSQKLTGYINAFSKAAAKGKADMEVLNTYLNQGVPILDTLAKQFGTTTAEIVEMTSQGKISFADFQAALNDLTAEGGQYFGGMELSSRGLAAMQEGLRESVNSLAASFGEMLLPAAIAVMEALTSITNAINESPLLKGALAAALVMIAGYLAAMAAKAAIAFAAQMSLNFAVGALNPVVLAATAAVAALAAAYVICAADLQETERAMEKMALKQRMQRDSFNETVATLENYTHALKEMTDEQIQNRIEKMRQNLANLEGFMDEDARKLFLAEPMRFFPILDYIEKIEAAQKELEKRRDDWIDSLLANTQAEKIKKINEQLAKAQLYLSDPGLDSGTRSQLQRIIENLTRELNTFTGEADRLAAKWKESWADAWNQFQAEQSADPFAGIELERGKKLADAWNNYVRTGNKETIDQVNAYYDARRGKMIQDLAEREQRLSRELTQTKLDDLEHEYRESLKQINELEAQRVIAAAESEEAIQAIREQYAALRQETEERYRVTVDTTRLEEARAAVADWQSALSDHLTLALMDIAGLGDAASVIIANLAAQLADLSFSPAISGLQEIGRALGKGDDAAESLKRALADMAQQILNQLPMMFLQAGLQLIASSQWALGLGFIAAAGSSAVIAGYVEGATENARGNVFDEYGKAARAFAAGGTFTNQIVTAPAYFRHGGGLGLMGEAGPEAIMPLKRMANGDLGVESGGGGAVVVVNVINNSRVDTRTEETVDSRGNKQIDVIIGDMVNSHIASGKADRVLSARYNMRAAGV